MWKGGRPSISSLFVSRACEVGKLVGSGVRKTRIQIPALLGDQAPSSLRGAALPPSCLGSK